MVLIGDTHNLGYIYIVLAALVDMKVVPTSEARTSSTMVFNRAVPEAVMLRLREVDVELPEQFLEVVTRYDLH